MDKNTGKRVVAKIAIFALNCFIFALSFFVFLYIVCFIWFDLDRLYHQISACENLYNYECSVTAIPDYVTNEEYSVFLKTTKGYHKYKGED